MELVKKRKRWENDTQLGVQERELRKKIQQNQLQNQHVREEHRKPWGKKRRHELRVQESHWMAMWKDSKNELKQMREDLKNEDDEEVRAEMMADIEGLKKRKGDWAKLLGLNEVAQPISASI